METLRNSKTLNPNSSSILDALVEGAYKSIDEGYYSTDLSAPPLHLDFKKSIHDCRKTPIIAEVKFASPSHGVITGGVDAVTVAEAMVEGGAVGLSILTEPRYFKGSIEDFAKIRRAVDLPLLMKDIVVSKVQVDCAARIGADAVLLIYRLFEKGGCKPPLAEIVEYAHYKGLQVLLEVHDRREFIGAVESRGDLIGVNNRDLETMRVDISTTSKILEDTPRRGKTIVSESGIRSADDIRMLRGVGVDAFLVGTSIMAAQDISAKVRELVEAV